VKKKTTARIKNKAKFWLEPVRLEQSGGFRSHEIIRIQHNS
jgi:hypothetical protein